MADATQQCDFGNPDAVPPAAAPEPAPGVATTTDPDASVPCDDAPPSDDAQADGGAAAEYCPEEDPSITEIHSIDGDLYRTLRGMGFSDVAVKKSIVCGCIDEGTCLQWLEMHLGVAELEDPLEPHVYVKVKEKRVLTEEERAAKVAELKAKIAAKKATDAQESQARDISAEKTRMQTARDARQVKEARDKREREQAYAERRREKDEDRAAKARIELELAVDRYVRKGMAPEEARKTALADREEKAEAARVEREKRLAEMEAQRREDEERAAKASASGGGAWSLAHLVVGNAEEDATPAAENAVTDFDRSVVLPPPTADGFRSLLATAEAELVAGAPNDPGPALAKLDAAKETLRKILGNLRDQPLVPRVRTIKTTSATFLQRLVPVPRACAFLRLVGFQEAETALHFTMHFYLASRVAAALEALA